MPSSRYTYLWVQNGIPVRRFLDGESAPLEARLDPLVRDEGRSGESLLHEAAQAIFGWALEHDASWDAARAGVELEQGVAAFEQRHGWRGQLAIFLDSLRLAWRRSAEGLDCLPRSALSEEAGFWVWSQRDDLGSWPDFAREWDGSALGPGRRMPSRAELARAAAADLEQGETILVHGFSEGIARALEEALRALAALDAPLELCYDAVLADLVPEADRLWIASAAIGARALLAQAGARRLAREALEHEVPLQVVATSDALLPGGALALPRWMSEDRSLLWVEAPRTVELRTAFLEELPLEEVPEFLTEKGRESAEGLCLRALRLERAPHCATPAAGHGVLRPARRASAPVRSEEDQRARTPS